jgi:ribonuclease BN (tRNA processing enzyme)
VTAPRFPVRVVEIEPGGSFDDADAGLSLRTCDTPHADPSMAVRLEGAWGALGYTGDTGPSDAVAALMAGCGVLETHLSPLGVAGLARVARPGLVVVTHVLPPLEPEAAVAGIRRAYDGPVVEGRDGLRVSLRRGAATVDPPPGPL